MAWRETLREYWRWKQEAFLHDSALRHFRRHAVGQSPIGRREADRIERLRALWSEEKLELRKIRCQVRILRAREGEGAVDVTVVVSERHVHRLPTDEIRLEEEVRRHFLRLKKVRRGWQVVEDVPLVAEAEGEANRETADERKADAGAGEPSPPETGPDGSRWDGRTGRAMFWRHPVRRFRRDLAVRYAESWWDGENPLYRAFPRDGANFVSQCLLAGGAPMTPDGRPERGWWYRGNGGAHDRWSESWMAADRLHGFLLANPKGLRALERPSASQLEPGDVICYDFDGDGRWEHAAVVVAMDSRGEPLVNAHSAAARQKHWSYRHSYAWTENIRYAWLHIAEEF